MGEENQNQPKNENKNINYYLIIGLILVFISIAIYNYDTILGVENSDSSFISKSLYILKDFISSLSTLTDTINSYLGTEVLNVLLVLLIFLALAYYISKEN